MNTLSILAAIRDRKNYITNAIKNMKEHYNTDETNHTCGYFLGRISQLILEQEFIDELIIRIENSLPKPSSEAGLDFTEESKVKE